MRLYKVLASAVLLVFYGVYFGKMFAQSKKGIRTHQIGSTKEKSVNRVERLMSFATLSIVIIQLISIVTGWNHMPSAGRYAGFVTGITGDLVFFISMYTMRDSWRAGIPESDETKFVSRGIYRYSRNPAFLGFDLMYTGILLLFFNPLLLVFTFVAILSLHMQILQEEKYLRKRFGAQYVSYIQRVRRYLGKKGGV